MTTRHRLTAYASAAAAGALLLAACGAPPSASPSASAAGSGSGIVGCMVSDAGGFTDKSFNEAGFRGLNEAKAAGVVSEVKTAESKSESDFVPNVSAMSRQGCGLTVTVGFLLAGATQDAAEANPNGKYALIDAKTEKALPNVKSLEFDTAQASFLAGYLAAASSTTGTVATFGGVKLPSVTVFMDGFVDGVAYYNEKKGKQVKAIGWNKQSQDGSFTGDFEDVSKGRTVSENLASQGADVIMPVAGPVGLGAAAVAESTKKLNVIWVDSDGYELLEAKYKPFIISSVLKRIDVAVEDAVTATRDGKFSADPYVGTLANQGIDLAPFHDWDAKVAAETKSELATLKQDIISGAVPVQSASSPK